MVTALMTMAACSGSSDDRGSPGPVTTTPATGTASVATTEPAPPSEPVAVEDLADLADLEDLERAHDSMTADDGSWDLDAVLAVFAARFGAVPGITAAPADLAAAVEDRELADVLAKRLDELTPEQRAVVQAWLEPGPATESHRFVFDGDSIVEIVDGQAVPYAPPSSAAPPTGASTLPTLAPDPTAGAPRTPSQVSDAATYTARAIGYIRDFARLSGVTLDGFEVVVAVAPLPARIGGTALPVENGCKMRLAASGICGADTLAHEAYHCFQFAVRVPLGLHPYNEPRWAMEGTAAYAGQALAPDPTWANEQLRLWLARPAKSLARRDYDALGLYETIEDVGGTNLFPLMAELLSTDTPAVPLNAALTTLMYGHWGAQYHDNAAYGPAFVLGALNGLGPQVRNLTLRADGPAQQVDVPALAAAAAAVGGLGGDNVLVLESTASGLIRFGDESPRGFAPGDVKRACFSDTGCAPCPSGSTPRLTRTTGTKAFLGAASVVGGRVTVRLESPDRVCGIEPAPTTIAGACQVGRWVSTELLGPAIPNLITRAGADGVVLVFGLDGRMSIDFDDMNRTWSSSKARTTARRSATSWCSSARVPRRTG